MAQSDEEEDYMTMVIPDTSKSSETSLQRRKRKERENALKAFNKPKAEKEAEEAAAREAALATAMDTSSKGFKMMAKLGFKPGDSLGKTENARKEPIHVSMKEDRGGIGHESEKKRKFREQMDEAMKRAKVVDKKQGEYVDWRRQELEEKQLTSQLRNAQKIAENMDEEELEKSAESGSRDDDPEERPLKEFNVVYRGLVRVRREKEEEAKLKVRGLRSSPEPSRLSKYVVEGDEGENDDEELEQFEALPVAERLQEVVSYLREKYHYCFWCMYRYPDVEMDGCPGLTERDHD
jgi:hypothetical protein